MYFLSKHNVNTIGPTDTLAVYDYLVQYTHTLTDSREYNCKGQYEVQDTFSTPTRYAHKNSPVKSQ